MCCAVLWCIERICVGTTVLGKRRKQVVVSEWEELEMWSSSELRSLPSLLIEGRLGRFWREQ